MSTASGFLPDLDPSSSIATAEQPEPEPILRDKPVVVTGASGLVGTHVCAELARTGWKIRAVVRDTKKAAERLGHLPLEIRVGDIRDSESMRAALTGAGSLVHLAAIAIEKAGESYDATNRDATRVLIDAAKAESVSRLVYMSQNGSDSNSPFPFLRSKGVAQDAVTSSGLKWTVLRPSVIFGPEDEFVNVLARLVRLSPVVFPVPGGGVTRFQPVAVTDVARAVATVLGDDNSIGKSYALGGPMPLSLRQMTERILIAMNTSRVLVGIPVPALRPLVALVGHLLPHPPVTTGLLDLLAMDNVVPQNDLKDALGIEPVPFAPEELLYLRKITAGSAIRSLFH
ncbi:MAG: complex I NDUFA9 subunit family protein [Gemmatimonadaceae bacterium]